MEIVNYQLKPLNEKGFVANYTVTLKSKKKRSLEEYLDSIRCFKIQVDDQMTVGEVKNLILKDAKRRLNEKALN
jgi:hypothetical protein